MEEILYNINIHKDKDLFLGEVYSDIEGAKEFKNHKIETLLKDIILDMQLSQDTFSDRAIEFTENKGEKLL